MQKNINISCVIVLMFIGASLFTTISQCKPCDKLQNNLNTEQLEIYSSIMRERLCHYYIGLILGIIIALIYYKKRFTSGEHTGRLSQVTPK